MNSSQEETIKTSRIPGFYKLTPDERRRIVAAFINPDLPEGASFEMPSLDVQQAKQMIENVIGTFSLPWAIATNFTINSQDYMIPMVIEEPSVVAGLSYAARLVRDGGGFQTSSQEPVMIGQMQIVDVPAPSAARLRLLSAKDELIAQANRADPVLQSLGGGARDIEVRLIPASPAGPMLILHLLYDVRDAMGANAVNTAVETLTPAVERLSGGRVGLRIISNLADHRLARAWGRVPKESLALEGLSGEEGVQRLLEAQAFAICDPYRAVTHNKGIMNGIDALAVATGNDWRAIEAGAHAYAARSGTYKPLTTWERSAEGDLVGSIELPIAAGIVGGATQSHPQARCALNILGVKHARELAEVMAAVGLAQNLAAMRALAMEGIQRGHMRLHARQVAMAAGAEGELIELVADKMIESGTIRSDAAEAFVNELRKQMGQC